MISRESIMHFNILRDITMSHWLEYLKNQSESYLLEHSNTKEGIPVLTSKLYTEQGYKPSFNRQWMIIASHMLHQAINQQHQHSKLLEPVELGILVNPKDLSHHMPIYLDLNIILAKLIYVNLFTARDDYLEPVMKYKHASVVK